MWQNGFGDRKVSTGMTSELSDFKRPPNRLSIYKLVWTGPGPITTFSGFSDTLSSNIVINVCFDLCSSNGKYIIEFKPHLQELSLLIQFLAPIFTFWRIFLVITHPFTTLLRIFYVSRISKKSLENIKTQSKSFQN